MLHYIHDYRRRLDDLRRIAGADNEGTLSPAFAGLLEDYGREHQLILAREWPLLMALYLGYESVEPWPLRRVEQQNPSPLTPLPQGERGTRIKPRLKADKTAGRIDIDELTVLHDVPPEAWDYRLGHRSALEWILEEYKETTPRDPTIREKFNTYRFADHKEQVIDLLMRVCRVSVETLQIIAAMCGAQR